jgi:hypothetical protein
MANLNHIQRIFPDINVMTERYGIHIFERKSKNKMRKRGSGSGRLKGKSATQQLLPAIFQPTTSNKYANSPPPKRQPLSGRQHDGPSNTKENKMVRDLTELVQSLDRVAAAFISQASSRRRAPHKLNTKHQPSYASSVSYTTSYYDKSQLAYAIALIGQPVVPDWRNLPLTKYEDA